MDSQQSYTAFFVRLAFKAGWRLAILATVVWKLFNKVKRENGLHKGRGMSMGVCTSFVALLMTTLHKMDSPKLEVSEELILSIFNNVMTQHS